MFRNFISIIKQPKSNKSNFNKDLDRCLLNIIKKISIL